MKIINFKLNGDKRFDKSKFEIDFRPHKQVRVDSDDLFDIGNGMNMFNTYAFVGTNASGKTTIHTHLCHALGCLINNAYIVYNSILPNVSSFDYEIIFEKDEIFYHWTIAFDRTKSFTLQIVEESLSKSSNVDKTKFNNLERIIFDTQIYKRENDLLNNAEALLYPDKAVAPSFLKFNVFPLQYLDAAKTYFSFEYADAILSTLAPEELVVIASYLDNSIESLEVSNGHASLKRFGSNTVNLKLEELERQLSLGTSRAMILIPVVKFVLSQGGIILIDEIDTHLHKVLVLDLISWFNDPIINKHGATLIFTTHYIEVLDILSRDDSTFVIKKENSITISNLSSYNYKNDKKKSNAILNGIMEANPNYEKRMQMRKVLS